MRHPTQPLVRDEVGHGILRFKSNAIVRHLLDHGGIDMNRLARMDFSREDWQQFAQLIGYSLSGYGDLSYVDNQAYEIAAKLAENPGADEKDLRIKYLEDKLASVRTAIRDAASRLLEINPDDLLLLELDG